MRMDANVVAVTDDKAPAVPSPRDGAATPLLDLGKLMPSNAGFPDFETACKAVLKFLQDRIAMGSWLVTRVRGRDWVMLSVEGDKYNIRSGQEMRWGDSYCTRMMRGEGPRVAPDAQAIPAYAAAEINEQLEIAGYVGVPLRLPSGALFGTLCGISREKLDPAVASEGPLLDLLAQLLSTVLAGEMNSESHRRMAETAQEDASRDPMTGLLNRRGLDGVLTAENVRCAKYGSAASIVSVDLNGLKQLNDIFGHHAGDGLIVRAADVIGSTVRASDTAARVGGDEFLILLTECDATAAERFVARLRDQFDQAEVSASIGVAVRQEGQPLQDLVKIADAAMYVQKGASKRQ